MKETFATALGRELSQFATAVNHHDSRKQPYSKGELVDGMVARLRPHLLEANPEDIVHAVICLAYQPNMGTAAVVEAINKVRGGGL